MWVSALLFIGPLRAVRSSKCDVMKYFLSRGAEALRSQRHQLALAVLASQAALPFLRGGPPLWAWLIRASKLLGVVTVNTSQPTTPPKQITRTVEAVSREQIEQTVNATDSKDLLWSRSPVSAA